MEKLSKQQKGFVKDYVETHNGTQAVLNNMKVKNENVAGVTATRLLRNVNVQNAILSIAEQIPDSLLVEKHLALLNKTDKKYKFTAIKEDLQLHIFSLRLMDNVRVLTRKEIEKYGQ